MIRPTSWLGAASATVVLGLVSALAPSAVLAAEPPTQAQVPTQASEPVQVTVMGRNLYLGSDVGEALALLPDLAAAGQFMWDEVQITNFTARAPALAAEAAAAKPAVIGLQEATTWKCTNSLVGGTTTVYDFTEQFMEATAAAGVPYVIAEADGSQALNPGYKIGPIPRLTMVSDPDAFQPLFGSDTAACGFELADALLVRADLAGAVQAAGTTEFSDAYPIVPWLFEIQRGYAWADIDIEGATIRFVATHLESLWDENAQNLGPEQARQMVSDLQSTQIPLVVMGDFNNDPRDPRPAGGLNPGGQPEAGEVCQEQVGNPTDETALAQCNAYWVMVQAGYTDAGPDSQDPANYTWGSSALLAGPDVERVQEALEMGNNAGWTDRLDYVFVRNGVEVTGAEVIGNTWPEGANNWQCDDPLQVTNTEAVSAELAAAGVGQPVSGTGVCLPTDHAGIVAQLSVTPAAADVAAPALPTNDSWFNKQVAALIGIAVVALGLLTLVIWLVVKLLKRLFGGKKDDGSNGPDSTNATKVDAPTPS